MNKRGRFGPSLRRFRLAQGMSQQRLAAEAEVSARHVSFVENGRSTPSREMVLVLGNALGLPLRERNTLLRAAGFVDAYPHAELGAPELEPVRRALDHLLRAHEPFGALVLDHQYDIVQMNEGAKRLLGWALGGLDVDPALTDNLITAILHPSGLRSRIVNWDEVATVLVDRARREAERALDEKRRVSLLARIAEAPPSLGVPVNPSGQLPVLPLRLRRDDTEVAIFSTVTSFGTAIDVTADELRIESFFPADENTDAFLRELARESS